MKLRNKLILSCAALAAVATTAFSTTFAWYTSNTKVTASNINSASASVGSTLLLIKDFGAATPEWTTGIADVVETGNALMPLQYNSGALVGINYKTAAKGTSDVAGSYCMFHLGLMNAGKDSITVQLKLDSLTNTTTTFGNTAKPVIAKGATAFGGQTAPTGNYTVDLLRVLNLEIESATVTASSAGQASSAHYDLAPAANYGYNSDTISTYADANAVSYYNLVMEDTKDVDPADAVVPSTAITAGATTNLVEFTVPAALDSSTGVTNDTYLDLTFKVFINGWDQYCFDAVQGQSFGMALSFQVKEGSN